jgi:hypothetical protein
MMNGLSAWIAFGLRYQISRNLGNEISLSVTDKRSGNPSTGADTLNVPEQGHNDSAREYRQGSCAYADIMSPDNGTHKDHPICERAIIGIDTRRVSEYIETVLGPACVGAHIFVRQ